MLNITVKQLGETWVVSEALNWFPGECFGMLDRMSPRFLVGEGEYDVLVPLQANHDKRDAVLYANRLIRTFGGEGST